MRTTLLYISAILVAGFLATPAEAQSGSGPEDYHIELGATFWKPTPDLRLSTDGNPEVDLVSTFGIEDKMFTGFNATLKAARKHKIRFSYVKMEYDKDATIAQTFVFSGRTFTVNLAANTAIEWQLLRLGYEFDIVSSDKGFFGLLAELKHNHVKASVTSAQINLAASTDNKAPIPTFGGIGRGYIVPKIVSVTVEVSGFKLPKRDDLEGKYLDFDIYATANLGKYIGIEGGYRSVDIEYFVDEDRGNLKMKGPYFGGKVRF